MQFFWQLLSNNSFFEQLEDWAVFFVHTQIYLAPILLLTLEESGIPIPLPGDVIIIYTGYQVAKGHIPYFLAFFIILIAVLLGSSILYFLARRYGHKILITYSKYIHLDEDKFHLVESKFKKYGPLVIIFGRHIPGFRIPVTIFAGISKVSYKTFITSTFVSVIFWIAINLSIGEKIGPRAAHLLTTHHSFYFFSIIPLVLIAIWWVITRRQKKIK